MRMRLKSNLNARLEQSNRYLIKVDMTERNAKIAVETKDYLDFAEIFGNNNPVFLDLGCGKGSFSMEFAKRNENVNIIGVEMISNVLLSALEDSKDLDFPNMRFMNTGVDYLLKYIKPHSISRIFLNFSTPKQKKTYKNSRLTHSRFLDIYKELLTADGEIHQKTDNDDFFEYSLESFKENGFTLKELCYDLEDSEYSKDNIVTEYELQFMKLGQPIKRVVAFLEK